MCLGSGSFAVSGSQKMPINEYDEWNALRLKEYFGPANDGEQVWIQQRGLSLTILDSVWAERWVARRSKSRTLMVKLVA